MAETKIGLVDMVEAFAAAADALGSLRAGDPERVDVRVVTKIRSDRAHRVSFRVKELHDSGLQHWGGPPAMDRVPEQFLLEWEIPWRGLLALEVRVGGSVVWSSVPSVDDVVDSLEGIGG